MQKLNSNTMTARSGDQSVPSPKHQNTEKCNMTNVFPVIFAKLASETFLCGSNHIRVRVMPNNLDGLFETLQTRYLLVRRW